MLTKWLSRLAREVHSIDSCGSIYMTRYVLWGSRYGNGLKVFLHHFQRSDINRAYHDHSWGFTSIILAGGYWEHTPGLNGDRRRWYGPGRILRRPATWRHWVEIPAGREAWTLVVPGAKERSWGFWESGQFTDWRLYLKQINDGCA